MNRGDALAAPLPVAPVAARERGSSRGGVELLVVGGATLLLLPLGWLLRRAIGLDAADYAFGFTTFYAAYVINDPHFAVTYLLFYRDAGARLRDRAMPAATRLRWWLAGVVVPAAIVLTSAAAIALHRPQGLGWLVQAMYLTVGWHYVKQGFGVLTVLCARRGVAIAPSVRRALLAHAYAAWAFAWSNPAVPAGEFEEKGVVYYALAHPRWLELATGAVLAVSTVALVVVLVRARMREGRALPVGPLAAFLVTVWSWTILSAADPLFRYVIPALHSVQYGYFVWLLRRNEARAQEAPPFFGRPPLVRLLTLAVSAIALGWVLFHGLPEVLDAALVRHGRHGAPIDDLGATPFVAAFYVFVNLHHFAMDAVLWRRDNPGARYLFA